MIHRSNITLYFRDTQSTSCISLVSIYQFFSIFISNNNNNNNNNDKELTNNATNKQYLSIY